MRDISAPFLVFLAIALPACGPRLPGIDMASQPVGPVAGADGGIRDAPLRATPPPPDATTPRFDATWPEARPDAAVARPEAGAPEARPEAGTEARADAATTEARADVVVEARPEVAAVETRPEVMAVDAGTEVAPETAPDSPLARAPRVGDIWIVEVLIDPDGNDLGHEWFEILSTANEPLSLAALHVADSATDVAVEAGVLAPGARLVLGQSLDRAHNGEAPVDVSYGTKLALNNDADRIAVCLGACGDGIVLDDFPWSAPLGAAYVGHAIVIDYKTAANCPATEPYGTGGNFGTPGGPDPVCPAPPLVPKLTRD
jgi:hypothetical protein